MGYSDRGYMGGEAQTPNLDKLSKEGVTFLNCFNNAKCAPSRAALMTGMSCQRVKAFKSSGHISENNAGSIAEVLGANGYETIIAGKWHIAPKPMDAGFQHQFGVKLTPYYFKPNKKRDGKLSPINLDGNPMEEAIRYYKNALRIDPNYIAAHNSLGVLYANRGEVETARRYFEPAD